MALSILRKLEAFNKNFMWYQKMMLKLKAKTTLTLEFQEFVHKFHNLIRPE